MYTSISIQFISDPNNVLSGFQRGSISNIKWKLLKMSVIQYLSVQVLKIIYMFVIGNYSFHIMRWK